jgi:hypothetical protein
MVVGKRINNNTTWKLGDESIEEVNEYKYRTYNMARYYFHIVILSVLLYKTVCIKQHILYYHPLKS